MSMVSCYYIRLRTQCKLSVNNKDTILSEWDKFIPFTHSLSILSILSLKSNTQLYLDNSITGGV